MHIGKRIQKIREKQKMSQTELAKGILSNSHLSNIESGRYVPQDDMLCTLAERFNLPSDYFMAHSRKDGQLDQLLTLFQKAIRESAQDATEIHKTINARYLYINDIYQETMFFLLEACYYLKIRDIQEGNRIYDEEFAPYLKDDVIEKQPNEMVAFYYHYHGVNDFFRREYFSSNNWFFKELHIIEEKYRPDLHYNISLNFYRVDDSVNAIRYAEDALRTYEKRNQIEDLVMVNNFLGALYRANKNIDLAIQHLNKALDLTNRFELDDIEHKARIYHNIGLIYREKDNLEQSLAYFNKSLEIKKSSEKAKEINVTFRQIIKILLNQEAVQEASNILEEARLYCSDEADPFHLKAMEAKIRLKSNDFEAFEKLMVGAVQYFKDNRYWIDVKAYARDLADSYHDRGKYKAASNYYRLGMEALENISKKV